MLSQTLWSPFRSRQNQQHQHEGIDDGQPVDVHIRMPGIFTTVSFGRATGEDISLEYIGICTITDYWLYNLQYWECNEEKYATVVGISCGYLQHYPTNKIWFFAFVHSNGVYLALKNNDQIWPDIPMARLMGLSYVQTIPRTETPMDTYETPGIGCCYLVAVAGLVRALSTGCDLLHPGSCPNRMENRWYGSIIDQSWSIISPCNDQLWNYRNQSNGNYRPQTCWRTIVDIPNSYPPVIKHGNGKSIINRIF